MNSTFSFMIAVTFAISGLAARGDQLADQDWPKAPEYNDVLNVFVLPPTNNAPPNDLFDEGVPNAGFSGTLVYAGLLYDKPVSVNYWVFRKLGDASSTGKKSDHVASYRVTIDDRIFDPQISPDGSSLLFKLGEEPWMYGEFILCIWDFKKQIIRRASESVLRFPAVKWSPDGKYLAYVRGGDATGRGGNSTLCIKPVDSTSEIPLTDIVQLNSFGWTTNSSLLYTAKHDRGLGEAGGDRLSGRHPKYTHDGAIFEVGTSVKAERTALMDGYNPVASPDNKWIAYLGWESADSSKKPPPISAQSNIDPSLFLYNRATKSSVLIRQSISKNLCWSPDSKKLMLLDDEHTTEGYVGANISCVDISGLSTQFLTRPATPASPTITAAGHITIKLNLPVPSMGNVSAFGPIRCSSRGDQLTFKSSIVVGVDHGYGKITETLWTFDLGTGKSHPVSVINNKWASIIGWDWREDSK